jgi:hypothetical protein
MILSFLDPVVKQRDDLASVKFILHIQTHNDESIARWPPLRSMVPGTAASLMAAARTIPLRSGRKGAPSARTKGKKVKEKSDTIKVPSEGESPGR